MVAGTVTGAGLTDTPVGDTTGAGGEVAVVAPLVVAGLGGLALSAGANLYSQRMSRALYRRQINAYGTLQNGYARHLAKHGRRLNPARAYAAYGGRVDSARTSLGNSYAGSLGTTGGTIGAGLMMAGKTRKWI